VEGHHNTARIKTPPTLHSGPAGRLGGTQALGGPGYQLAARMAARQGQQGLDSIMCEVGQTASELALWRVLGAAPVPVLCVQT
jgi:hypothetical protein